MGDKLMDEIKESLKALIEAQMETDRQLRESQKDAAQHRKEEARQRQKEARQWEKEAQQRQKEAQQHKKEMEQRQQDLSQDLAQHIKKMSDEITRVENLFTTKWGKLMESLVDGDLVKLLQGKDIEVTKTLQNIRGKFRGEHWEVDILAINGEEIVVVEVKTTLKVKDVGRFIARTLKNFVAVFPEYKGKKNLWRGGLSQGGRGCRYLYSKTGPVRNPCHRLFRQHCQR